MTTPLDLVLSRLDGVVQQNGHFMARCPAHDDRNPSLQVTQSDTGAILLRCFAGCETPDILHQINLTYRDLFPAPPARIIRAIDYRIKDRQGNLVATHHRQDFSDGTKNVSWPRGTRPKALPLYGIHERRDDHTTAIVVEGEKARDALNPLTPHNILVVGTVCGAGATPSLDTLSDLAGLDVVLWPDNDDPGRRHMERIAALLATPPQWIEWPDAPPKGDAADYVSAGMSYPDSLTINTSDDHSLGNVTSEESIYVEPAPLIRFRTVADLVAEEPDSMSWIVEPWAPAGGILKIDGAPKAAGKTTFLLAMIRAITTGEPFLGRPVKQGPVVMLTEQGSLSFTEAAHNAGIADSELVHVATFSDFAKSNWPDTCAFTFAFAREKQAVLLVIDTLPACSKVRGDDENSAGAAMGALEPIQLGVEATGIGCAITFHDKKSGGEVGNSGRGSSAYAGAVEVIVHLTRPGGNMPTNVRRIQALSRYAATPQELYISYQDGTYTSLGSDDDVQSVALAKALRDVLPREASNAMPVADRKLRGQVIEPGLIGLLATTGVKIARSTLDHVLFEGQKSGAIGCTGPGRKGVPSRYWLADERAKIHSSDAPFAGGNASELFMSNQEILSSDGDGSSEESISPGHPDWVWSQPELDETDNR